MAQNELKQFSWISINRRPGHHINVKIILFLHENCHNYGAMQKVRHSQNRVFWHTLLHLSPLVTLSHFLARLPSPHVTHPKVTNFELSYIKNIALGSHFYNCLLNNERNQQNKVQSNAGLIMNMSCFSFTIICTLRPNYQTV